MAFIGVRISWLMFARNSLLARLAASRGVARLGELLRARGDFGLQVRLVFPQAPFEVLAFGDVLQHADNIPWLAVGIAPHFGDLAHPVHRIAQQQAVFVLQSRAGECRAPCLLDAGPIVRMHLAKVALHRARRALGQAELAAGFRRKLDAAVVDVAYPASDPADGLRAIQVGAARIGLRGLACQIAAQRLRFADPVLVGTQHPDDGDRGQDQGDDLGAEIDQNRPVFPQGQPACQVRDRQGRHRKGRRGRRPAPHRARRSASRHRTPVPETRPRSAHARRPC
jgi:hypothetical protein